MNHITEEDFKHACAMAAYCALCAAALSMAILLAIFGDEFVALF
jgi:hypothetical protein